MGGFRRSIRGWSSAFSWRQMYCGTSLQKATKRVVLVSLRGSKRIAQPVSDPWFSQKILRLRGILFNFFPERLYVRAQVIKLSAVLRSPDRTQEEPLTNPSRNGKAASKGNGFVSALHSPQITALPKCYRNWLGRDLEHTTGGRSAVVRRAVQIARRVADQGKRSGQWSVVEVI